MNIVLLKKYPEMYDLEHGIFNPANQRKGNEKIFNRIYELFELMYGSTWIKKFSTKIVSQKSKRSWMGVLSSMTYDQITRAMTKIQSAETPHNKYPPQILEFKYLGIDKVEDNKIFFCCYHHRNICMRRVNQSDSFVFERETYYSCSDHINLIKDELELLKKRGECIENKS